ncbi:MULTISPECIES: 16S rRNA (cytosine(1402)-N(4))-methyltransferase RsmH [Trueperella]|uniref:16S rRNA (cytosine(1402)-N(4))-methyltransferase RsmH n=1 Tax=Trueperella TaxID=1069494 RepID=UPI000AD48DBB|nr:MULTISPECIES: 16S rRNA (cytosine(1402)-N(4))-methyltransferase RsmH [Trueperella]
MADASNNALHVPVLARTCLDLLAPALESGVLIDCTLGMGGHSEAFLTDFPNIRVVGIDRDPAAIRLASERLARFGERFTAVHTTYDDVDQVAARFGEGGKVEAILMDLGVSSLQLDEEERGFSYAADAPLDMRMDTTSPRTAADILATEPKAEIARILRVYGEEKFAGRISEAVVRRRDKEPLTRTGELVEIVRESIPAPARRTGGNPAKRTFQALRIAVNGELDSLRLAVPRAIESLKVGGRLAVESYQSLEDRIVKDAFAAGTRSTTPAGLPLELEGHGPYLKALTRGAIKATEAEIAANPRSASVRLRAVERIAPTPSHLSNPDHRRDHL